METTLSVRQFALDDNDMFNVILSVLCRVLKNSNEPFDASLEAFRSMLSILVTEGTIVSIFAMLSALIYSAQVRLQNSIQSVASLVSQWFSIPWITIDILDAFRDALYKGMRMCVFGQQPYVDYSVDFVSAILPTYLRMILACAKNLDVETHERIRKSFDEIWKILGLSLLDIDVNIQVFWHCHYHIHIPSQCSFTISPSP